MRKQILFFLALCLLLTGCGHIAPKEPPEPTPSQTPVVTPSPTPTPTPTPPPEVPDETLVNVQDYLPGVYVDLRYATPRNSMGRAVYDFTEALLRYGTVKKLAVAADTLADLPLFHALRYEAGKVGGKDDVRAFVRGEFPHETFMDMAAAYLEAGLNEEVRELLGFAGEHPLSLLWQAFLERNAAALARIATRPGGLPIRGP